MAIVLSKKDIEVWATRAAHAQGGARNVAVSARRSARSPLLMLNLSDARQTSPGEKKSVDAAGYDFQL